LACLLIAVLAPMLMGRRGSDEPFSGYSVMGSPRDMHVIAAPIRLSAAPDLTISRGTLYADGNAAAGTPISRFVLDGPVLHLNASGLNTSPPNADAAPAAGITGSIAPLLVEQLAAMGFDVLTVRRGTLHVTANDGSSETISDIQAELSGRRKANITAHGSFSVRGQRLSFEGSLLAQADKRAQRWPMKVALKGDLLEVRFDGHLSVAEDLQLAGQIELASSSLRRAARWFGVPLSSADGLNATVVKGQVNWARNTLAVEGA